MRGTRKKGEKNGNRKEGKEVRKKEGEAGGEKRGMSRDNGYGSLNENSFPGTLVFKHLISSEWFCLERLWNLQETKLCWRKNVLGGSASRVYGLNSPPILSFYFLFMGVVKPAAWSCHQVTFPSHDELNPSVTINQSKLPLSGFQPSRCITAAEKLIQWLRKGWGTGRMGKEQRSLRLTHSAM